MGDDYKRAQERLRREFVETSKRLAAAEVELDRLLKADAGRRAALLRARLERRDKRRAERAATKRV